MTVKNYENYRKGHQRKDIAFSSQDQTNGRLLIFYVKLFLIYWVLCRIKHSSIFSLDREVLVLEAASRGAQGVCFVEKNKHLGEVIKKNIPNMLFRYETTELLSEISISVCAIFLEKNMNLILSFRSRPTIGNLVEATLEVFEQY